MKNLLLILSLTLIASVGVAQTKKAKWVDGGCGLTCIGCSPDTVTKCYRMPGKDSLTYTISTQKCNCDIYTTIGDHKTHPCKGLLLHSVEVHWMYWYKDITFIKGVKISETKPHWGSNISETSDVAGVYEQNGEIVYVHAIHFLKHKLINNTQPYKFAPEWVVVNDY